jgi:predicted O-linked N-acetylglucosamine transferase (SPINDLY family)
MASFGNTYKITPEMFATWMRLLHRLPNAVLWLIDDNEASTANLRTRAEEAGVDVSRLHFSPRTTHSEFCGRLKLADVFLDTYPYNCGSTSNDVLNSDIPLVSICGKTLVSRMSTSLLDASLSRKLIGKNYDEYLRNVIRVFKGIKVSKKISGKKKFKIKIQ